MKQKTSYPNNEGIMQRFYAKVAEIAATKQIILPKSYYRYSFCRCWNCKKETLVFSWPGKKSNAKPFVEPRPASIQYQFSKTSQMKYWANACIHCGALQGDFFLYNEPDGPFWKFDCGEDATTAFEEDQTKLAEYLNQIGEL
ncbi:MAG: hypothetical protein KGJ59_09430 [Bacteroidota bacterium]|nr:hypothetical protein [Bacteroidota bacterium]